MPFKQIVTYINLYLIITLFYLIDIKGTKFAGFQHLAFATSRCRYSPETAVNAKGQRSIAHKSLSVSAYQDRSV